MKKFILVLLTVLMVLSVLTSCVTPSVPSDNTPEPTPEATPETETLRLGLHVEEDGTITLYNEPYYGFGTNWHGVFMRFLGNSELDLDVYFQALADGNIPYIRFMAGVFYASSVGMYVYDKEAYFTAMDKMVATAEKYKIGLIPSLMWNIPAFYEFYGEDPKDCMADPEAKATKLMIEYTTEMVTRYKDSPAIWAWEYGNEGNLAADRGSFTSIQLGASYKLFGETVRKYDDYRMILTGDSSIFECSHALRTTGQWSPVDTAEERIETLKILNPDPINCLSTHIYGHADTYQRVELVATDMQIAKDMGKGLFVGEYGPGYSEWDTLTGDDMVANWNDIVDIMLADGVQMAAQWGFGRYAEQPDGTSIELGFYNKVYQNEYQYERLKKVNADFIAQGKTMAPKYWEDTTPLLYGTSAWKLDGSPANNSKTEGDLLKDVSILANGYWEGNNGGQNVFASRSTIVTELSDGTMGKALRCKIVGTEGSSNFTNRLLLGQAISLGKAKTYTLKVTAKFTLSSGDSFQDGSKAIIKASSNDNSVEIIADGQWHTYTYTFTTANSLAKSKITIGGANSNAKAPVGTELIVESVELFEN